MTYSIPRGRFRWNEEIPKNKLSMHKVRNVLNQFEAEASECFNECGSGMRSKGVVCNAIGKLIDYLKNVKLTVSIKRKVLYDYNNLLKMSLTFPHMQVLHHNLSNASHLMSVIKEADEVVLHADRFWMVHDERHFSREEHRFENVSKLMGRSDLCLLRLDQHSLGFGDLIYEAHNGNVMPQQECFLLDFISCTLALDKAVEYVMSNFLEGPNRKKDLFCEALFYNLPKKFKFFYDRDTDINRFEELQTIGFGPSTSLIDGDMLSASVRAIDLRIGKNCSTYDAYDVPIGHTYHDIMKLDSRISTEIILNDDGVSACIRKKIEEEEFKNKVLRVIVGVNKGAIITSMFGSRTLIHVENAFLGTYNYLVLGAPKIWYVVPKKKTSAFRNYLLDKNLLHTVIAKTCFVRAFSDRGYAIPTEAILDFDIHMFVQYPGMSVMSVPGEIYHWTISCGFNIAEAGNYFTTAPGDSLASLESSWEDFVESGGCEGCESSVETSSLYFKACKEFGLL